MDIFVKEGLQQIDIGEDYFVKVPISISFDDIAAMGVNAQDVSDAGKSKLLLQAVIKEWNFKLEDGTDAPISAEVIGKLTMPVVSKILAVVKPMITIEKKS
jgi:hypothetical protein